jgi:hypothetical protein
MERPWTDFNIFSDKIPYFTFYYFQENIESVKSVIKKHSLTIIDTSHDPVDITYVKQQTTYHDVDNLVVILTSNYKKEYEFDNVIFCPYQFFRSKFYYRKVKIQKRNYKASCINRNPIGHKLYTYFKLYNNVKFKDMMLSFNGLQDNPYFGQKGCDEIITINHHKFRNIPEEIKRQIELIDINKSAFDGDDIHSFNVLNSNNHPAYTECYLNLVTETSAEFTHITEKTFKPIISGQLFLISGSAGQVDPIRHMGFDTYDDLFSNHEYDLETEMITRVDKLIDIFDKSYDKIEDLYFLNQARIEYNQNYMCSQTLYNRIIEPLKQRDLLKIN